MYKKKQITAETKGSYYKANNHYLIYYMTPMGSYVYRNIPHAIILRPYRGGIQHASRQFDPDGVA